jgi:hypothetical protein
MSRIGKSPVTMSPAGVTVEVSNGITVKEKWSAYTGVSDVVTVEEGQVQADRSSDTQRAKTQPYRSLINILV